MVRFLTTALVALSAISVMASAENHTIKGKGAVAVHSGNHAGMGVTMMVNMDISSDAGHRGFFVFAGEDHDHYPGLHIKMSQFDKVEVSGAKAEIEGFGTINGQATKVQVEVEDGAKDKIHVKCFSLTGEKMYDRQGDVLKGNIEIKVAG